MLPNDVDNQLPSPWDKFLTEVDGLLPEPVELHCLGGFVVVALYGFPRPTSDIDLLSVCPSNQAEYLQEIAGKGSKLHKKYGVWLQNTGGIVTYPDDYESRLIAIFHGRFKNLSLKALEAYDLVLSKLDRNWQKDREDVEYLAKHAPLDAEILRKRYEKELRSYMADAIAQKLDNTLNLWVEAYLCPPLPNENE